MKSFRGIYGKVFTARISEIVEEALSGWDIPYLRRIGISTWAEGVSKALYEAKRSAVGEMDGRKPGLLLKFRRDHQAPQAEKLY